MNDFKVAHVLMTDYALDSRVRNETVSLQADGFTTTVFCLKSTNCPSDETRENVFIKRFGIASDNKLTFIIAYIHMFLHGLFNRYDLFHAHDVTALPVVFLLAKIKNRPFVYDSHELWSQSHHAISSRWLIDLVCFFEKRFACQAAHVITVSESIRQYLLAYFNNRNISVIRNIPSYTHEGSYDLIREAFGLDSETRILIYQGMISKSRGVDLVARVAIDIARLDYKAVFVFIGNGPYLDELRQLVADSNLADKIFVMGAVDQNELLKYTMSADIGIHAINNSCLNHDYCLPNKLFEYIQAGLVLVVTGLTEMKKFIDENEVGVTFRDGDVADLEQAIISLMANQTEYAKYKNNSRLLAKEITWNNEYQKLKAVYTTTLRANC